MPGLMRIAFNSHVGKIRSHVTSVDAICFELEG